MKYSRDFLRALKSIKAKRPRTVIDHILKHGQITTEELKNIYGYNHPPRAKRDVIESGIPIKTIRVADSSGRKIAAYTFGDSSEVRVVKSSGRTAFSKQLKKTLIDKYGSRCNIYLEPFPERELQIDHRIPFEIAGDSKEQTENTDKYMLLCASANRAKSWSCEHCENWKVKKPSVCRSCYWAYPEKYKHIAMHDVRRLDILWVGKEAKDYERLKNEAGRTRIELPTYVKNVLRTHFKQEDGK
ncbi:MAG: HNH endonuclease [Gammaproteobacteria bacterium]